MAGDMSLCIMYRLSFREIIINNIHMSNLRLNIIIQNRRLGCVADGGGIVGRYYE